MMTIPKPQVQKLVLKHQQFMFLPQHTGPGLVVHIEVQKNYSFVYLNFKISIQIMKIFIIANCFHLILKEHYVSETHLFRPQVKRFEEAITQLGSLETATRFIQKLRISLPSGPNRINASLPLTLQVPVSETLISFKILDSGRSQKTQ
jgi:hypothetical protein